jgi:hypothetical protein
VVARDKPPELRRHHPEGPAEPMQSVKGSIWMLRLGDT